ASRRRVAIVAILHLNRGNGGAMDRLNGSVGYGNTARQVLFLLPDPDDSDHRLLLPGKSNLSPRRTGIGFRLESLSEAEQVSALEHAAHLTKEDRQALAQQLFRPVFTGEVDHDPTEVLQALAKQDRAARRKASGKTTTPEQCAAWLLSYLGEYA